MQIQSKSPAGTIAVLILSSCDTTRASLLSICAGRGWKAYEAKTSQDALGMLNSHPISVIIADGNWREIIENTTLRQSAASVIVTARFADEALWAEVLNLGGFDVLAQPFDANEVVRITQAAYRRSTMPNFHPLTYTANALAAV